MLDWVEDLGVEVEGGGSEAESCDDDGLGKSSGSSMVCRSIPNRTPKQVIIRGSFILLKQKNRTQKLHN